MITNNHGDVDYCVGGEWEAHGLGLLEGSVGRGKHSQLRTTCIEEVEVVCLVEIADELIQPLYLQTLQQSITTGCRKTVRKRGRGYSGDTDVNWLEPNMSSFYFGKTDFSPVHG